MEDLRENGNGYFSFTFPKHPYRLWAPLSFLFNGYLEALSLGIKWLEREADQLPQSNADVKSKQSCTSPPHICRHGGNGDNFSFTFKRVWAAIAQSVQRLATGWTVRGSNPGGGEIFRKRPDWPWGRPSLLYKGYLVISGGKAAEAWC